MLLVRDTIYLFLIVFGFGGNLSSAQNNDSIRLFQELEEADCTCIATAGLPLTPGDDQTEDEWQDQLLSGVLEAAHAVIEERANATS